MVTKIEAGPKWYKNVFQPGSMLPGMEPSECYDVKEVPVGSTKMDADTNPYQENIFNGQGAIVGIQAGKFHSSIELRGVSTDVTTSGQVFKTGDTVYQLVGNASLSLSQDDGQLKIVNEIPLEKIET